MILQNKAPFQFTFLHDSQDYKNPPIKEDSKEKSFL